MLEANKQGVLTNLIGAKARWDIMITEAVATMAYNAISAAKGIPFPANLVASAVSLGKDAPQVATIYANKPAQYGFEGIVDEPTQFTVGEAGAEMVSVAPLEGPNNAGGGGMNIVIQGNVMTDEFVEDVLIEKIQDAVYRGAELS